MKKRFFSLIVVSFIMTTLWAQSPILGDWITIDDVTGEQASVVRIYQAENGRYYGDIIQLFGIDESEAICVACTGEDHNQPVVGLTIIRDMQLVDGELRNGRVLDPDNGKIYYAKMYLKKGKLVLRGSLDKAGLLGRSQTWIRK